MRLILLRLGRPDWQQPLKTSYAFSFAVIWIMIYSLGHVKRINSWEG